VVDFVNLFELQANEALVSTSKGLFGRRVTGVCGNVLALFLGSGLAMGGTLVDAAMLASRRDPGGRSGVVVIVVATSSGNSGNTTVEKAVATTLCGFGRVPTNMLDVSVSGEICGRLGRSLKEVHVFAHRHEHQ